MSEGYRLVRPIEYSIGSYVPGLTESCVNIFKMEVDPNDFTENRCSFAFKSPGLNTLLSSAVYLEFDVQISTPSKFYDYAAARLPNFGMVRGASDAATAIQGATPTICFGEGNVLAQAMQSYQLTVNGAVLQQIRMDEWKNSCDKLFYPSAVMQRRFGRAGGAYNKYDSVAVSGDANTRVKAAIVGHDANNALVEAFTQDSGISKRIQSVLACTKQAPAVAGQTDVRVIRVRAPLENCGIFNYMGRDDYCSNACPLKNAGFCLPHFNVVNISILWKNLFKTLIRNLSSYKRQAAGATIAHGGQQADIQVAFAGGGNTKLCVDYIRLGAWRQIPATRTLAAYRVAVHDATSINIQGAIQVAAACVDDGVGGGDCLPVVGVDRAGQRTCAAMANNAYVEANWNGVVMSQIPSYLAFVAEKPKDALSLAVKGKGSADHLFAAQAEPTENQAQTVAVANQGVARNTSGSLSPVALDLMIQSSVGSYQYSGSWPYLKQRSELFKDTLKNATLDYCDGCEDIWQRNNGIIFLSSADFARCLGSEGSSMPVVFNAKIRMENRREFIDGTACSCDSGGGIAALQDTLCGFKPKPIMLAWYPRMSLAVSPSSALVSSQNISHASALQLLSQTESGGYDTSHLE